MCQPVCKVKADYYQKNKCTRSVRRLKMLENNETLFSQQRFEL